MQPCSRKWRTTVQQAQCERERDSGGAETRRAEGGGGRTARGSGRAAGGQRRATDVPTSDWQPLPALLSLTPPALVQTQRSREGRGCGNRQGGGEGRGGGERESRGRGEAGGGEKDGCSCNPPLYSNMAAHRRRAMRCSSARRPRCNVAVARPAGHGGQQATGQRSTETRSAERGEGEAGRSGRPVRSD